MYFCYNNINYNVPRLQYENDDSYNLRKWCIVKMNPKNEKEFIEFSKIAKLYVNMKLLKCNYKDDIKKKVLEMIPDNFKL